MLEAEGSSAHKALHPEKDAYEHCGKKLYKDATITIVTIAHHPLSLCNTIWWPSS